MPTGTYLTIHAGLFVIMLLVGGWFVKKRIDAGRTGVLTVIGFAVLFRVILIPSTPIHESDFYRYLWDGKVASAGINPFLYEPGALELWEKEIPLPFFDPDTGVMWRGREFSDSEAVILRQLAELRDENPELFERVSHKAVTTIYPPVGQGVYWVSSVLFGDSLAGLKVILVAFDIGVILVIVGLLRQLRRNTMGVIFYAWNPLVLKEFANSAHYDSVPIFFTTLAVYFAVKSHGRVMVGLSLAAGTLAKFFSVLLIPVLTIESPLRNNWRGCFRSLGPAAVFSVAVGLGFLPFLIWDEAGFENVFRGLTTYNGHWEYNAGLFAVFRNLLPFASAKLLSAGLLILVVGILTLIPTRDHRHLVWKAFAVVGALFVLSPTAFPWYFAWVLPFLCVFPRVSWLMMGALLPLNYLDFHSAESIPFAHATFWRIPSLSWICWGVFFILFCLESIITRRKSRGHVSLT